MIAKINKVIKPYKVEKGYYTSRKLELSLIKAFSASENINYGYPSGKSLVGKTKTIYFKGYVNHEILAAIVKKRQADNCKI